MEGLSILMALYQVLPNLTSGIRLSKIELLDPMTVCCKKKKVLFEMMGLRLGSSPSCKNVR
jgi:hypothetical protein